MATLPSTYTAPSRVRKRIRVMVVDDSVVVRRLLTHAFSADDELEVVGSASSSELALQKLPLLQPDVMTLDINMPGMSGLELLPILRERFPLLRVLIFSTVTQSGAAGSVDALLHGASDYFTKPAEDMSLQQSIEILRSELTSRIRQLVRPRSDAPKVVPINAPKPPMSASAMRLAARATRTQREVLAVGVSTGGPTALATFIAGLPLSFPLPIVIVQHMPPVFTRLLADRIRSLTGFLIEEATEGMLLQPGKAILAPGDFHMRLEHNHGGIVVRLDQGPHQCSCRPSVDVLFRSVAQIFGRATIATVLTGMGQDGLRGTEELKRAGAYVVAQDENSSVVWGMPGAIVNAGLADEVLDIGEIANAVITQAGR